MRKRWIEALSEPYAEDELKAEDRVSARLGLIMPKLRALIGAVFNDLDATNHGIGWWADDVDVKRRVLIGDHLLQLTVGISRNLIEARLHELEIEEIFDNETDSINSRLVTDGSNKYLLADFPDALSELWIPLADAHIVGFLRAIGSALDCLGSAAIGVLALPADLFRSDWATLRRVLSKQLERPDEMVTSEGLLQWRAFGVTLEESTQRSGPEGWLDWTLGARNMLVHRPRRINQRVIEFIDARADRLDRVHKRAVSIPALWQEPGQSEIEVLRTGQGLGSVVLTEPAWTTIAGIRASTLMLSEKLSESLNSIWLARRANPGLLFQPEAQWAEVDSAHRSVFRGYEEGSLPAVGLGISVQHPSDRTRLRAADLLDDSPTWGSTDADGNSGA